MGRGIAAWIAIGCCSCAVLFWNGTRFVGTRQQPRIKDLDFLPSPVVAQALSCGQGTSVAKLRWIDSFAYFQLQLDKKDDRVSGADARGGFERLYDTLLALDPYFIPFYEHAVLNTSGVLKNHQAALSFLMRGLIKMPHDTGLWRLSSAVLAVNFSWSTRASSSLDRWLGAWAAADQNDLGRQSIEDWRRGLAFSNVDGLETLPYWLEQLHATKPGSPFADFVEGTVRELLAEHGAHELTKLNEGGTQAQPSTAGVAMSAEALRARWPQGSPAWEPVRWEDGRVELRADPFGYLWQRQAGKIISPGREQRRFLSQQQGWRTILETEANQHGRPASGLAEAAAWGVVLPEPPYGGRWSFEQRMPDVVWPEPPEKPWPLR